jgi:hypothetical protein
MYGTLPRQCRAAPITVGQPSLHWGLRIHRGPFLARRDPALRLMAPQYKTRAEVKKPYCPPPPRLGRCQHYSVIFALLHSATSELPPGCRRGPGMVWINVLQILCA